MNKEDYFVNGVFHPVHQFLSIRAISTNPLTSEEDGKKFLVDLVKEIEMTPVTQPQAVNVRSLGNEGLTGSINLSTSHIAYHCWENTGLIILHVYSCTCFDVIKTVEFIRDYWNLTNVLYKVEDPNDLNLYNSIYMDKEELVDRGFFSKYLNEDNE